MAPRTLELPEHLREIRDDPGDYFEPGQFCDDEMLDGFMRGWFSAKLRRMQEPKLLAAHAASSETYRLLVLPTFHQAAAIRVWQERPGVHCVTRKMLSGLSGFGVGDLCAERTRVLWRRERMRLVTHVEDAGVWDLPTRVPVDGLDGTTYVLEAHRGGRRHVVERWSPRGGPFQRLVRAFAKIAGLSTRRW